MYMGFNAVKCSINYILIHFIALIINDEEKMEV